jgi:hypothetical protein
MVHTCKYQEYLSVSIVCVLITDSYIIHRSSSSKHIKLTRKSYSTNYSIGIIISDY